MLEKIISYSNNDLDTKLEMLKVLYIFICTYLLTIKILNKRINFKFIVILKAIIMIGISIMCILIKDKINYSTCIFVWIFITSIIFDKNNIKRSICTIFLSLSVNYILFIVAILIGFVINLKFEINNNFMNVIIIFILHTILLTILCNIKRFKYGIASLKNNVQNEYIDMLILTVASIILFSYIIFLNASIKVAKNIIIAFSIFSISMLITIQKSLQLYYKQQMLIKDLNETREELEKKKKEIAELEAENIEISKKRHTIVHKQKSIEHKLEELLMKTEISKEESVEVKERLEKLHTQIYSEKENTSLDKTGISNIDDMLNYMQSECKKNKIEFTLVIKGNIYYMVNNLITKEDLETLLADHIRDAIIAINHTDNINKSILVKLGNFDGIYCLYIYDSGVEFKKEVLENLGKKPFTTYKDKGGTGMGFMNTFDTLRKCKASLIIEEFNEPCTDNYTKVISIKFDEKSNFSVKSSYRDIKINCIIK